MRASLCICICEIWRAIPGRSLLLLSAREVEVGLGSSRYGCTERFKALPCRQQMKINTEVPPLDAPDLVALFWACVWSMCQTREIGHSPP